MSRRPNQVSLKDLFTTNPGELLGARYASDSALDSASQGNSQYLYSQAECFDSQDGQQLPHSQNLSQSPTTRFFNRYMAKGSVIGHDGSQSQIGMSYSTPIPPKLPSQQQIQLLKARTQEQDERDMRNSLVSGMRECSAEVRVAVACLKESTQLGIGSTECQLTKFTEKIQSSLEKSQSVIVETLSSRDSARTKETELEQQLAIKNARIEELERQIQKMSQEKQDVTIASLQSTCEDLSHKITESLESFFCRNQNALTRLEVVEEKQKQLAVNQMKQYLQQHFQDQKDYMKGFLEGFKALNNLQSETMQIQNGMLTSEILKSLHIVQENQLKGFEEFLIHQIKELLEKKELNQKELFEEQYQRMSVIQQEQRHEVLQCLQSEIKNSSSEQKKQFISIIEDCISQEKNKCFQMQKEFENVENVNKRCAEELKDNKDHVSSEPLLMGRIDVIRPELTKYMNKNAFPVEQQPDKGLQMLPIHRKAQPEMPSVQQIACDGYAKELPSVASSYEFPVEHPPTALSCTRSIWDKDVLYAEGTAETSLRTSNSSTSFRGDKPDNRGKLQPTEVVDLKFVSPLPSGNNRSFIRHRVCKDSRVNPSPVALVIPQVQAPKPMQLQRNNELTNVVQTTAHSPGTTVPFSGVKSVSFASPELRPAAVLASTARAKAPTTSQVKPSCGTRVGAFTNAPTPQARASSLKKPMTRELISKCERQPSNSPAGGRKVSKKRRGNWSRASQSRKRSRKQPIVEVSRSDSRKQVTNSKGKTDRTTAKKPNHKQSVISKVLSPLAEVFDFHSDTSAGSDDDSPVSNKRFLNHEVQLSTYSRVNLEGRRMTRSASDFSKSHLASKFPDLPEMRTKAWNHGLDSICSKSSTFGKTGASSYKEICNSVVLRNNSYLERNPSSKEGYCSSSASSSPCWSIGDILKQSEMK